MTPLLGDKGVIIIQQLQIKILFVEYQRTHILVIKKKYILQLFWIFLAWLPWIKILKTKTGQKNQIKQIAIYSKIKAPCSITITISTDVILALPKNHSKES